MSRGAWAGGHAAPPLASAWPPSPGRGLPECFSSLPGCPGQDRPHWHGWVGPGRGGGRSLSLRAGARWRTLPGTGPITECEGERAGILSPGPASACGRVRPGSPGRSWPSRCRGACHAAGISSFSSGGAGRATPPRGAPGGGCCRAPCRGSRQRGQGSGRVVGAGHWGSVVVWWGRAGA